MTKRPTRLIVEPPPPETPKRGPGQPRKLVGDLRARFLDLLEAGMFRKHAAMYVGVAYSTVQATMRAEPEFKAAVLKAELEATALALETVKAEVSRNWKAAAWYLAHKHPEQWGDKLEAPSNAPAAAERSKLEALAARLLEEDAAKAASAPAPDALPPPQP